MKEEHLQTFPKKRTENSSPSNIAMKVTAALAVAAGSFFSIPSHNVFSYNFPEHDQYNSAPFLEQNTLGFFEVNELDTEQTKSDEIEIANLLKSDETRAILIAALGLSASLTFSAYLLGRKYDENKLHALRVCGPALMTVSAGALLFDSYKTIDSTIPAGIFLGSVMLSAGHIVINTFQHHRDPKIRATALSGAGFLISVGITTLLAASDKI